MPERGPSTVVLDIPARKEYVALVRQVVSIIAGRDGRYEGTRVDDLKLAASEACANAIEAYDAAPGSFDRDSARVVVEVRESDDELVVSVDDNGPGFDPETVDTATMRADEHPAARHGPPHRDERGRGVSLIRTLVDEASFESSAGGTSVTMALRSGAHLPAGR